MTRNQLIRKAVKMMPTSEDLFAQFSSDTKVEKTSGKFSYSYSTAQELADVTSCKIGKEKCLETGDIIWVTVYYGFKATFACGQVCTGEIASDKEIFYVKDLLSS